MKIEVGFSIEHFRFMTIWVPAHANMVEWCYTCRGMQFQYEIILKITVVVVGIAITHGYTVQCGVGYGNGHAHGIAVLV
jgi:hypothetical protein